ncbi:MAG: hypothetical protein JSS65_05630 [Armatimonadetes bacterium]|nr:hypothetical protein [Armatimonadota bacterium]
MARWRPCLAGILILLAGCREDTYIFPAASVVDKDAPSLESIDKKRWAEMNAFALATTRAVANDNSGNVALCPLGLWSAGAVLLNAANGTSFEAASSFLGLKDPSLDDLNAAQRAWHASLPADGPLKEGLGVFMIWPVLVAHDFQDEMARDYRADVMKIGSAGDGARNSINAWASRRTGGAIENPVQELSKQTIFTILHVASFKGKWTQPFKPDFTEPGTFHLRDGSVQTPMMRGEKSVRSLTGDQWVGAAIPFKDDRFAFVAAMPKVGDLDTALASAKTLPSLGQQNKTVHILLPKCRFSNQHDLLPILQTRGAGRLLEPPNDLRRMSVELDDEACIRRAYQVVDFELDEQGVVVKAVTGVDAAKADVELPDELVFDKPFFWGVIDVQTGVYVFTGVVRDPSKG